MVGAPRDDKHNAALIAGCALKDPKHNESSYAGSYQYLPHEWPLTEE